MEPETRGWEASVTTEGKTTSGEVTKKSVDINVFRLGGTCAGSLTYQIHPMPGRAARKRL